LNEGYEFIAFGGFVGKPRNDVLEWCHKAFKMVCPKSNDYFPLVKVHGFAMTAWRGLVSFPWYSVDSASWIKKSGFGQISAPVLKNGIPDFTVPPITMNFSSLNPTSLKQDPYDVDEWGKKSGAKKGYHYDRLSPAQKEQVGKWFDSIGVPIDGEDGLRESRTARAKANVMYYQCLAESVPKWPWPYNRTTTKRKGFGVL